MIFKNCLWSCNRLRGGLNGLSREVTVLVFLFKTVLESNVSAFFRIFFLRELK